MMTLGELCDLVAGRITVVVELKSRFDGDGRLPARVAQVLGGYGGPVAPMSFDPRQLAILRQKAPRLVTGIVAAKYRPHPYWDLMPAWMRHGMGYLVTALTAQPQFIAYAVADLPAVAPLFARRILGLPLLTWAVRTAAERHRADRWADQMIFEGFRP
jgi:glycerophosphoryl diester phosphodiesterase